MITIRPHLGFALTVLMACGTLVISAERRVAPSAHMPPTTAPARPGPAITVYSTTDFVQASPPAAPDAQNGYAFVRENRILNLSSGESRFEWAGIPSGIDLASLSIQPADSSVDLALLEHTYLPSIATPDGVLQAQLGREIIINRRNPGAADAAKNLETITGKLLAFDRDTLLIETNNRQLPLQMIPRSSEISEIKFVGPTNRLPAQPVVAGRIRSQSVGPADVNLTYRTTGLSWQCNYNLILKDNDQVADLTGWVSICNHSGTSYPPANLRVAICPPAAEGISSNDAQEYEVPQAVELTDNASRQIALITPRHRLPISRVYVYRPDTTNPAGMPTANRDEMALCVLLRNDAKEGLGVALPPGRIRIYRQLDPNAPPLLLAESTVPATPIGRPLLIKLAASQAVLGQRQVTTQIENQPNGLVQTTQNIEVIVYNRQPQAARVIVLDTLSRAGAQIAAAHPIDWQDARHVQFSLEVGPSALQKLSYAAKDTTPPDPSLPNK